MAMNMRERIAREIYYAIGFVSWEKEAEHVILKYRRAAAAVLDELMKPSDYIGEVISDHVNNSMGRMTIEDGRELFTAAIRAAKEGR